MELTFEAIRAPFADTDRNPFTGRAAVDEDGTGDDAVELKGEVNFALMTSEETGGGLDAHVDVVDLFSPAETPGAGSVYTHKPDVELDAATAAPRPSGRGEMGRGPWSWKDPWIVW